MQAYDTVSEAIYDLKSKGYTEDFNIKTNSLECRNGKYVLLADDLNVDSFYRFEGDSNPDDESIVYAISAPKHELKGVLVAPFGMYSEPFTDELTVKLNMNRASEKE